ncbi:MAG: diadenylate cyclase CdaA [Fimbriimonadaceae bacterium]|nr:diadenylate cyclase CdaA [Fimbriimonadaceae bacterium]
MTSLREFSTETLVSVIDILVVAMLVYKILSMIRGTRAWRVVMGIVGFLLLLFVSKALGLNSLHWILEKATLMAPVALAILLLPELRQALEGMGKFGLFSQRIERIVGFEGVDSPLRAQTIEELVAACAELADSRTGALIVIERGAELDDIIANGVKLGSSISAALLGSIFYGANPLHDGAVVIRGDRIVAAACRLPLSDRKLSPNLHMRHRAAVGASDHHDCIVIVVSEERGTISLVREGQLSTVSVQELRDRLNHLLRDDEEKSTSRKERHQRRKEKTRDQSVTVP